MSGRWAKRRQHFLFPAVAPIEKKERRRPRSFARNRISEEACAYQSGAADFDVGKILTRALSRITGGEDGVTVGRKGGDGAPAGKRLAAILKLAFEAGEDWEALVKAAKSVDALRRINALQSNSTLTPLVPELLPGSSPYLFQAVCQSRIPSKKGRRAAALG